MKPEMRFNNIDVVTDRGALRRLIGYASGKNERAFCIFAQMINNTLFLCRRERWGEAATMQRKGAGRGQTFEKMFTTDYLGMGQLSGSYYRVHRYNFGSVEMMVQHEVDAYYEDSVSMPISNRTGYEDMGNSPIMTHPNATAVEIRGKFVYGDKLAEIKASQSIRDGLYQCWIGRTPWLLCGKSHGDGDFCDVSEEHVEATRFKKLEEEEQLGLRKTAGLLRFLVDALKGGPPERVMLVVPVVGMSLEVREMKGNMTMLPRDIVDVFWNDWPDELEY
jgi:hypothetical protein